MPLTIHGTFSEHLNFYDSPLLLCE